MKNLASAPFYFALLVLLLLACTSCGFVHKVFDKKKQIRTEIVQHSKDSTSEVKTDSAAISKKDSSSVKKSEEKKESDVVIEFEDSSDRNQVEIIIDTAGRQTIKATGKIKSVKTRSKSSFQKADSHHVATLDSTRLKETIKVSSSTNTSTVKVEHTKTINRDKKSFSPPWWSWLLLAVILVILYIRYRRKIATRIASLFKSADTS